MKDGETKVKQGNMQMRVLCVLCVGTVLMVSLPLLILGFYNYPMADDWSYGIIAHKALGENAGFLRILSVIAGGVKNYYLESEPRFANILLGELVPSAWGTEHWYYSVAFLMIIGLILCEFCFFMWMLQDVRYTIVVLAPSLAVQLLCVPFPTESFYWYVGAVNYTFVNALSLVLISLFFRCAVYDNNMRKSRKIVGYFVGILLAVLVGGDNFGTSLSRAGLFCVISVVYAFSNRQKLCRTLPLTIVLTGSLIFCMVSPGSQERLSLEYANAGYGALESIWQAISHTVRSLYVYTDLKIVFLVLMVIPFVACALRKRGMEKRTFRFPGIFTLITFLLYASEIVPNYYVEGGIRGGRMADIYYYDYHLFLLVNVIYWTGWFVGFDLKWNAIAWFRDWFQKHFILWFGIFALCAVAAFAQKDLKTSSSYRAVAWLANGYAAEYKEEWEKRIALLKDPSLEEVFFEPIRLYHEMVFYADFSEDTDNWVNMRCADYYGKKAVGLRNSDE